MRMHHSLLRSTPLCAEQQRCLQARMGVKLSVLDPADPCPAAVAAHHTVGSFAEAAAIEAFVKEREIDILTVEIEHVDVDAIEQVLPRVALCLLAAAGLQPLCCAASWLCVVQHSALALERLNGVRIRGGRRLAPWPSLGCTHDTSAFVGHKH